MLPETRMYNDFIRRHGVKITRYGFLYNGTEIRVYQTDDRKWWYAGEDGDNCYTKRSAIYWWLKNNANPIVNNF